MNEIKLCQEFIQFLKERNFDSLESLLHPNLFFRAVVPSKDPICAADSNTSAIQLFKRWFGDAERFNLIKFNQYHVGENCYHIFYHFRAFGANSWFNIEQDLYCNFENALITHIRLACSDFLKE